jgi:hypothetical protein
MNHLDNNQDGIRITFICYVFENIFCLDSNENNQNETNDNIVDERGSVSFKEYKKLEIENINLRKQNISLENQLNFMKKNYVRK